MRTRWLAPALMTTTAAMAVLAMAAPAAAGGAPQLRSPQRFHRPGEAVVLREDDVTKLSREWHGPYRAFLRWAAYQPHGVAAIPLPPPQVEVGAVVVERHSDTRVRATLSFVMPALPTGLYEVIVCSPGCRERLGDLGTGTVYVGFAPPAWEEPVVAAPAPAPAPPVTTPASLAPPTVAPTPSTTSPATVRSATADDAAGPAGAHDVVAVANAARTEDDQLAASAPGPWWFVAAGGAAVVGVLLLARRRRSSASEDGPAPGTIEFVPPLDDEVFAPDTRPDVLMSVLAPSAAPAAAQSAVPAGDVGRGM